MPSKKIPRYYPVRIKFTDKTRTIQSAKKECDINNIMANWKRTGVIAHGQTQSPQYEDLMEVPGNYHDSMNEILAADEAFQALPAAVRKKFNNDPGQLLDNLEDPATLKILEDAGLLKTEKRTIGPPTPDGTPLTPPAPAPASTTPAPGEASPGAP